MASPILELGRQPSPAGHDINNIVLEDNIRTESTYHINHFSFQHFINQWLNLFKNISDATQFLAILMYFTFTSKIEVVEHGFLNCTSVNF